MDNKKIDASIDAMIDTLEKLKHYTVILSKSYSSLFECLCETYNELIKELSKEMKSETQDPEKLNLAVESLGLCTRTCNALVRTGVCRVSDILNLPKIKYYQMKNFGKSSARELEQIMHELGYEDFKIDYSPNKSNPYAP